MGHDAQGRRNNMGCLWWTRGADPNLPAHRPSESLMSLSNPDATLVGQPMLAEADGQLVVVGETVDGCLLARILSQI